MDIVARYFAAFNAGDVDAMLACLSEDVAHHVNQAEVRHGKPAFAAFCAHMSRCYAEVLTDLVIFSNSGALRAAAEYTVQGTYVATDDGLPAANGQTYSLPAGSFFDIDGSGKISRVTTYYNMTDWLRQVS